MKETIGVILAQSSVGEIMIPISWNEMMCPKTKEIQHRKVDKLLSEEEIQMI